MTHKKNADNEEWVLTEKDSCSLQLPSPPPPNTPSYNKSKGMNSKHLTRKERYNISRERKWKSIIDNTILLSPDWLCKQRKKIFIFKLQIDLESFLIGILFGICLLYMLIWI